MSPVFRRQCLALAALFQQRWPEKEDGDGEDDEKESEYSYRTAPLIVVFLAKTVLFSQKMPGGQLFPALSALKERGSTDLERGRTFPNPTDWQV